MTTADTTEQVTLTTAQRLDDMIRQTGELTALLAAIQAAKPCPILKLADEMAHRLDDAVEEALLAA